MTPLELKPHRSCDERGAECGESAVTNIQGGRKKAVSCTICFYEASPPNMVCGARPTRCLLLCARNSKRVCRKMSGLLTFIRAEFSGRVRWSDIVVNRLARCSPSRRRAA